MPTAANAKHTHKAGVATLGLPAGLATGTAKHSHTAQAVTLAAVAPSAGVTANAAKHGHTAQAVILSATVASVSLVIANTNHTVAAQSPICSVIYTLQVARAVQSASSSAVALSALAVLRPDGVNHILSSTQSGLLPLWTLNPASNKLASSSTNIVVTPKITARVYSTSASKDQRLQIVSADPRLQLVSRQPRLTPVPFL